MQMLILAIFGDRDALFLKKTFFAFYFRLLSLAITNTAAITATNAAIAYRTEREVHIERAL